MEELKEYVKKHIVECIEHQRSNLTVVPKYYHEGYVRALWNVLFKIDQKEYLTFLDSIVTRYGDSVGGVGG